MLEFQGICFYILSAFNRNYKISLEAGLKYLIVNSISSSLLLFGFSLIYMYSGLTFFEDIYYYFNYVDNIGNNIILILGINIFTFGLFFKIYAVPFHLWIPDIYAGAPISTTLFISTIPLIVNFYLFIKFYFYIFIYSNTLWFFLILFISVLSMFLGCLGVAYEHELKRLVAYSSIYNTGFILSLFLLSYPELPDDIFSYILSYVLGLFVFFILLLNLRNSKNNKNIEVIDDLYGIFKYNKYLTFFFAVCVFQLSGVPPFISFITKIALQGELVSKSEYVFIFIIIVITTTINIYGYLRLLKSLIFERTNNIVYFSNIKYHIYVILSILLFISFIGISINGEEFFDFLSEYIVFNFYN
jgi:NADH-quinone oxidoreductase subunit N